MPLQGHLSTQRKAQSSVTKASTGVTRRDEVSTINFDFHVDFEDVSLMSPVLSSNNDGRNAASSYVRASVMFVSYFLYAQKTRVNQWCIKDCNAYNLHVAP